MLKINNWLEGISLRHYRRTLQVIKKCLFPLNSRISQGAHFFAVELFPPFPVKLIVKFRNRCSGFHIDKSVSDIAFVLIKKYFEVNWQVKKVVTR